MKSSSQSHSPRTPSPRARGTAAAPGADHARSSSEPWVLACVDDTCVNDVESFARTVAAVKSKPRPDLLPSVLSHYAAKWLPDVATYASGRFLPPESPTATWLKKRLLLETLVAALPPDPPSGAAADDGITCDFLLKLVRAGSMVGADAALLRELESRAARRLDQATLAAVMIPTFGHAPGGSTLLDVRLVREFLKEGGKGTRGLYGLWHAHPGAAKEESKSLWRLIDAWKLSVEGAAHAVQNY
ncbi:BTB/POZ domain-containing protein At1g67900-like [Triticum aestivum]|uniref:BTB/POZ domain-containing protein At1g67900-like n=1 Tax=Triticum aestivum TaxID=4565 RepID=UPI001D00DD74|nr:BTB/POZ domain-containing protein At1g67900-like [Triticum aestivum]